jgi:mRNA interferase RelE/StbE
MGWTIEIDRAVLRDLGKFDPPAVRRILAFLHGRVATLENPRNLGKALRGSKVGKFWRYRVGDYRIVAHIEDDVFLVLVVSVARRDKVYR